MGYLEIENLYKDQCVLMFKKLWATEKIDGTSAHIHYNGEKTVTYFSGGGSHDLFIKLFDQEKILNTMQELFGSKKVTLYGEFYGGKIQKRSYMYGLKSDFILFDIQVDNAWLSFDKVVELGKKFNLDVVESEIIDSTVEEIERVAKKTSALALKKGMGEHLREGIVLHPLIEVVCNNGNRVIAKYRNDVSNETKTPRPIADPEKLKVLQEAKAIADEWVTPNRLNHVLNKLASEQKINVETINKKDTSTVIQGMIDDVIKESKNEIVDSNEAKKEIGVKTHEIFFEYLKTEFLEKNKQI